MKTAIRGSKPKVDIAFPPPLTATRIKSKILDPSHPDDRIIEEALVYRETRPNEKVALLTHDTNPMLTAKRCGLPFVIIPDSWLLPPEVDQRDKKIKELEQKLEEFEKTYAQVDIRATPEQTLPIAVTTYEPLPEQVVKEITAEVQSLYPEAKEFNKNSNDLRSQISAAFTLEYRYRPPSEFEINKYRETDYPQWSEKIEKFFRRLHRRLESPTRYARHSFVLSNQGIVPAENIIVEFRAVGGLLLQLPADDHDEDLRLELPLPPVPPEGKWVSRRSAIIDLLSSSRSGPMLDPSIPPILRREERDRHIFYSRAGSSRSATECVSFECDEFRHQVDPEAFEVVIVVPSKNCIEKGAIECVVSAKNLPTPIKKIFPIQVEYKREDTVARAKEIVEKEKDNSLDRNQVAIAP